jgi:hypothetical protein
MRNSYPDRSLVDDWFQDRTIPTEVAHSLIDQLVDLRFSGSVCLQHFNEPLLDSRIADLGRYAKEKRRFSEVLICTNGELIDAAKARELDGAFDTLIVTLYPAKTPAVERARLLSTFFQRTRLAFNQSHIVTHFSPDPRLPKLVEDAQKLPCIAGCRHRMVVNHRGDMLLCCDDLVGHFGLGNVQDQTLRQLWYSEKHQKILLDLESPGGRLLY